MKTDGIILELKSAEGMDFNSWEIGNYLSRLASYHYKMQVIKHLKDLLEEGRSLSDLFILSNSFHTDLPYKYITDVKNINSIYSLLNTVHLIPILPNPEIELYNISYNVSNREFDHFKKSKDQKRKKYFIEFYNNLKKTDPIEFLKSRPQILNNLFKTQIVKRNFNNLIENSISIYKTSLNDSKIDINDLKDDDFKELIDSFRKKLSHLHRPVIGYYNSLESSFDIILSGLISNSNTSKHYFKLVDIHKTNPVSIQIDGFGEIFKKILNPEKIRLENILLEQQISIQEQDIITKKLDNIERALNLLDRIDVPNTNERRRSIVENQIMELLDNIEDGLSNKALILSRNSKLQIQSIDTYV